MVNVCHAVFGNAYKSWVLLTSVRLSCSCSLISASNAHLRMPQRYLYILKQCHDAASASAALKGGAPFNAWLSGQIDCDRVPGLVYVLIDIAQVLLLHPHSVMLVAETAVRSCYRKALRERQSRDRPELQ